MTSLTEFFNKHEDDALKGITHKNSIIKRNIIAHMAVNGECTLSELTKELHISVPTITKLVQELVDENIVTDLGKVETPGGRRPNIFGLANSAIYFAGVNVGRDNMRFLITDLQNNIIKEENDFTFELQDRPQCIERICSNIERFIAESGIDRGKILGLGVCMTGRVNPDTGRSYKYFTSSEQSLRDLLEERVGIRVLLENDTRARCYAEYTCGKSKDESNVLYLHMGRGVAIGIVVDDAIVVVEAVQAKFDEGYRSAYRATIDAMDGITSALVTTTFVFMAVFIPVAMMGGTSGIFYTQFGITMAVAVGISAVNALTLSPALCALLLKPYVDEDGNVKNNFAARFRKAYNTAFGAVLKKYQRGVMLFIKHKWLTWATLGLAMVGLVLLMNSTKTGLVPDEDQGTIMINVTTAPGSSLAETNKIMGEIGERLKGIPQIRDFQQVAGYGMIAGQGNSYGMCIVKLKDWSERPDKADAVNAVIGQIYARTADIKDAQIFAVAPPMITGYGTSAGFEMYLQDRAGGDITDFYNIYLQYIYALNQRPEIQMAYSTFNINFPQYMVDIDAAKAKRAGISPTDILSTLSGYYGGQYVSNINRFSKVYRVMIQADPKYRLDPESLNNVYVRMQNGEMAPISQFVKLTKVYGSEVLSRFNMYNSIAVSGTVADGYSTGDAIEAIEEVAEQVLPKGYGYDFGGLTREESQTGSNTAIIFGICIILIYLILSALYESFLIPFAVILAVPCGLLGSFILVKLIGQENNIYLQTGLIMIIGLLSKTAILITEYAADRRKSGMSLSQAAFSAAKARLRPILMTVLTCVFGMIPLVIATGVGANGNSTLGSGVVGGMIVGTLALLFLVPSLFIVFQHLQEKVKPIQFTNTPDWMIEAEIEDSKKENEEKK